ncbi:YdaS family helix-turn-helix protein [Variovorax sp. J22G40]|uniref:transcriptional regulator n=1 Tax=Variovorax sp. J22G40 TaxID=3053505 RepID=UPI0025759193|nr:MULTISPECIES: YdaS family helix-turn-helix protein [unclassified Variovorax]MDM0090290.1 YdaS family helix-turn-helix protein [Variovorax sp. J22G40]MDM0148044.1 YdaS family helix-turn-helix protein [Variovorax sp. J2P1-31]
MKQLRAYLNSLSTTDQAAFARRCGTTVGYLRKALSAGSALSEGLCINIERESKQQVRCEFLRPTGVDWAYIRGTSSLALADEA